jgi:hypothetical protein
VVPHEQKHEQKQWLYCALINFMAIKKRTRMACRLVCRKSSVIPCCPAAEFMLLLLQSKTEELDEMLAHLHKVETEAAYY